MNNYKKEVTIKDISKIARVSISTVSRALRRDPNNKSKTTERILEIAKELDYFPNLFAKGLREKKTSTIGVIFNDMNNPFYTEILKSINNVLFNDNFSMIVNFSNWDFLIERNNIRTMLSKRVDGIIISPISDKSENINLLIKNNLPSVLIDCYPYFKELNYVYTNHKKAAVLATNYLIKNGHKDILIMGMFNPGNYINKYFLEGYKETLSENNIKLRDELIIKTKNISIENSHKIFSNIIKNNLRSNNKLKFTAVMTISDLLAIGIYSAVNEAGIKIPEEFSIIGYDNIEFTKVLVPKLTTIHQPRKRIGTESTNILLNIIKSGNNNSFINKVFEPEIILRESVIKIN